MVDNTTGDPATKKTAEDSGARYIVEPRPGLSRARNLGLRESRSEIIAFLDDDAIPDANWLGALLEPFANPAVGAATGGVFEPGKPNSRPAPEPTRLISNQTPLWFEMATFGGIGLGCNMALRRSACDEPRMFDERLGRGAPFRIAEENHAFAKLLLRGQTVALVPSALVQHEQKWAGLEEETRNSITYGLLLLAEFPAQRMDLIRFLARRLRRKSLTWPRSPQEPGQIINSGWGVRLHAGLSAILLFLRTRKNRD